MKMQQINIIGDPAKKRRIDYDLIDKINKEYEIKARKVELEARLAGKKETQKKERKEKNLAVDIRYIKTPDELRKIKGNYSLQNGVYVIDFDIHVPNGCGLILEPGVEFYFAKDAGITCEGRFEAKGEDGLEVLLTAKDKEDGWKNLYLIGGAEAIVDYARFCYGKGRKDKDGYTRGGAVLLEAENNLKPSITINNSCFEKNSTEWGGAISNYKGKIRIKNDTKFRNNSTIYDGGAIYNNIGEITINNHNKFENNSADHGGAIHNNEGNIEIKENNRFEKNSADFGAAICNWEGYIKIKDKNIFEKNSSSSNGGTIQDYRGVLDIDKSKNIFKNNIPEDRINRK